MLAVRVVHRILVLFLLDCSGGQRPRHQQLRLLAGRDERAQPRPRHRGDGHAHHHLRLRLPLPGAQAGPRRAGLPAI